MRHRLDLAAPNELDLHVVYGWDPIAGFFGELRSDEEDEPIAEYSAFAEDYEHQTPLLGLLRWLVLVGALTGPGLAEGLTSMMHPAPVRLSRQGRKALRVISSLRREAD